MPSQPHPRRAQLSCLAALVATSLAAASCGNRNDVSPFVGTYTRPGFFPGSTARLTITAGGMAMEDNGQQESMVFGGELFCDSADHCAMTGFFCSIDIARQAKERIVITADRCDRWAGVWTLDPSAPPITLPPRPSGSGVPSGAPTTSAPPFAPPSGSGTPTAAPTVPREFDALVGSYERPGFFPRDLRILTLTRSGALVEEGSKADAVRFELVTCDAASAASPGPRCHAEGPSCRVDFERRKDGKLVVIAGGQCDELAGVWSEHVIEPAPSASSSGSPSASAAPSAAPSAPPLPSADCPAACADGFQKCTQACLDDPTAGRGCTVGCRNQLSNCVGACPR